MRQLHLLLFVIGIFSGQIEPPVGASDIQTIPTDVLIAQCQQMAGIPLPKECYGPGHLMQQPVMQQLPVQQTIPYTNNIQPMANPVPVQQLPLQSFTNNQLSQQPQANQTIANAKLSTILNENQMARKQIMHFLEYSGVPPPWDQLLDFETTQHHQLPDPENLFRKIRNLLLKFDNIKNCIVEALLIIEKYIGRGKAYISEDLKDPKRYRDMLRSILKKLCGSPSGEVRNELFKRFYDVKCKAKDVENSFYKLRDWIVKITQLFKTL